MGDEDREKRLPQRERGAARPDRPPAVPVPAPVLSEELRQRIQAAVMAERSGAAAEQQQSRGSEVTTPPVHDEVMGTGGSGGHAAKRGAARASGVAGKRKRDVAAHRPDQPQAAAGHGRTANAGRTAYAGPVAEDEVTEWLDTAVSTQHAGQPAAPVQPMPAPQADARAVPQPAGRARVWLAALLVTGLIIGSLAVVAGRYFTRSPGRAAVSAAAARRQAMARDQAASWVTKQISPGVIVSCDPAMYGTLTAYGFPSRDLLVIGPTSPVPVSSGVVVETAAVQDLFGSSLATAWAPTVLASFGSGSAGITIRVIAPHGAAAYQNALHADLADRKTSGTALLNDSRIVVSPTAKRQLAAGQVDSRLLLAIASVAAGQSIDIVDFGNIGPGAGAGVPLRFVDLAEDDQPARLRGTAYVQAMRASLSHVNTRFRPARTVTVVLPDGQAVLRAEVTAPSPLGVFGDQGPG